VSLEVVVAGADQLPADPVAVGVPVLAGDDGPELVGGLPELDGLDLPSLDPAWSARQGFKAKAGQVLSLRHGSGPVTVLVGLGPGEGLGPDRWRLAAAAFVRAAGEGGTAVLVLPTEGSALGAGAAAVGSAAAEGAVLAAYRFDRFRSHARPGAIERLVLVGPSGSGLAEGVRRGARVAGAVSWARDLINTPPGDLPPHRLAEEATAALADRPGTTVEVWDESRIAEEHLGGLLGVSQGSAQPPRLVRAHYQPAHPIEVDGRVPHVVLVGKGITFDSGGLSLKTADGMTTMKTDMSGAAIVLAALAACADLAVPVEVTAVAPVTENMPGSRAIKPGDVLTIRNGSTIEVLNTDAEGRLVLADALVLAAELRPDLIVDVATLTGAAAVALGNAVAPVFANRDEVAERVRAAGARAGEKLWPFPMPEEYAEHIDSDVADMKNIGRPGQAGAIVAAILLARFVDDVPWAHLDIAGTGRSAEATGYLSKGGTAFGVRTLIELVAAYGPPPAPD
jgi:leucyl aminopeptidase